MTQNQTHKKEELTRRDFIRLTSTGLAVASVEGNSVSCLMNAISNPSYKDFPKKLPINPRFPESTLKGILTGLQRLAGVGVSGVQVRHIDYFKH